MKLQYKNINIKNIIFLVLLIIIVVFSLYARTNVWLFNFPFFDDEVNLLRCIMNKNYVQLFIPMDEDGNVSTPFFLILARMIYLKYGLKELELRIIPYIASILSVFGFLYLSFLLLKKRISILFANFLFTINNYLIIYTYSFKQYSFDFLSTIIILITIIKIKDKKLQPYQLILLSLFATLLILGSYTAGFIICTSILTLIVYKYVKKNKEEQIKNNDNKLYKPSFKDIKIWLYFLLPFGILSLCYFFITCLPSHNEYLHIAWQRIHAQDEFFFPETLTDISHFLYYLFGSEAWNSVILGIWFLISVVILFKKDKLKFLFLISPFILGAFLGYTYLYPFAAERVSIYLTPIFIIILCYLFDVICKNIIISGIIFIALIYLQNIHSYHLIRDFQANLYYSDRLHKYFVELLYQADLKPTDYIYVKGNDKKVLYLYDRKKILDKTMQVTPIFDKEGELVYYNTIKTLNNIPKNSIIYFHTANLIDSSDMCEDEVKWIENNCKIIFSIYADYGDFVKCKKIN